ncbi:hypothetical protein IMSAG013_00095 [Clostridiales bacterium]|nr:hypothetical protein [Clostridiales bacterium]GFI55056.1 hypothetical protein IMSAG013_00095 [Clostridiales bacterium]
MENLHILNSENTDHLDLLVKAAENAAREWLQAHPEQQTQIAAALEQRSKTENKKKKI